MLDLDPDHAAAHDWDGFVIRPVPASRQLGVQSVPGLHSDGAVAGVRGDETVVGLSPGSPIRTLESPPMTRGSPARCTWSIGTRRGICVKDTIVAYTRERLNPHVGQVVSNANRVVTGIEDEERDFSPVSQESDEPPDLLDGRCGGVDERCNAHDVKGCRPRVRGPVQLTDPLIGPPGHDRLSGRVF